MVRLCTFANRQISPFSRAKSGLGGRFMLVVGVGGVRARVVIVSVGVEGEACPFHTFSFSMPYDVAQKKGKTSTQPFMLSAFLRRCIPVLPLLLSSY